MAMDFLRQSDMIAPSVAQLFPVTLIGCGCIGSPTALLLAKMGIGRLTLMDGDTVEAHNLPNQLFRLSDRGRPKALALADIIRDFSDASVAAVPSFFDGTQKLEGIVVSGVDSMKARSMICDSILMNLDVPLYIDGRTGGEIVETHTVRPCQVEDIEFYEHWLFPDEEGVELPCTARAILYTGFVISATIASQIKKWLNGEGHYRRIATDLKTMMPVLQSLQQT